MHAHNCSIVLRVADGAAVSIAYGLGKPEPVATRSEVETLSSNLNDLTALLQLTRNEALGRDARLDEMSAAVSGLAFGTMSTVRQRMTFLITNTITV